MSLNPQAIVQRGTSWWRWIFGQGLLDGRHYLFFTWLGSHLRHTLRSSPSLSLFLWVFEVHTHTYRSSGVGSRRLGPTGTPLDERCPPLQSAVTVPPTTFTSLQVLTQPASVTQCGCERGSEHAEGPTGLPVIARNWASKFSRFTPRWIHQGHDTVGRSAEVWK